MNFLKEESQRSIAKLYNDTSFNLKNRDVKEQLMLKNHFTYSYNYKIILNKSNSNCNLNLFNSNNGNIIGKMIFQKII